MKGKYKTWMLEHLALAGIWITYTIIFVLSLLFSIFVTLSLVQSWLIK